MTTRKEKQIALAKARVKAMKVLEDIDKGLRIPHEALVLWALYNEQIQSLERNLNND